MPVILERLRAQSLETTIFVWDNSPAQDFDDPRVDWIVRSSRNARCAARWWMAAQAQTDFVLVHDDDLAPSDPAVLADTLEGAARAAPFAVGASGVILAGHSYWKSEHVGVRARAIQADTAVDIVKGFYFCCPTARLRTLGALNLDAEDDIAVSAWLSNDFQRPHRILHRLQKRFSLLPEHGAARRRRRGHRAARDTARYRLFPRR